ncbi:hypothetical protein Vretimale_5682 [Volvox reticuliferus]|uniref:HMG box domain-containing protein n=1 Tax=Volvox reticuliferus TaxID=1737510 RepID=A0A8J4G603_9CHLO|nr:hypothetical protein Vretifemale_5775 [Volvox reticuliferus]GIM00752.1 hypothetical protein Vretimale_5682 [Volvox reticuliferus]
MLRRLTVRGLRAIVPAHVECPTSPGLASARELSGQACSVVEPDASFNVCKERFFLGGSACSYNQMLQRLSARVTPRFEIWRHFATTITAAVPPHPAVSHISMSSQRTSATAAQAKLIETAKLKNAAASKSKATRATMSGSSPASSTARGRAATKRRQPAKADKVKAARVAANARAAESIAKAKAREKAHAQKLKSVIRAKIEAVARVRAESREKLKAAMEKVKAAEKAVRLAKAGGRMKRQPSALNMYTRDQIQANPKITLAEVAKRFKELSLGEKQKYVDLAIAAKAELKQEREKLAAERSARSIKSSYMFFMGEQRPVVQAANPGISMTEIAKRLGEIWRGMSAEQRQKYVDLSDAERKAKGLESKSGSAARMAISASAPQAAELFVQ